MWKLPEKGRLTHEITLPEKINRGKFEKNSYWAINNNLPWKGEQTRSPQREARVYYIHFNIGIPIQRVEQIIRAILRCGLIHVHHNHVAHGIDFVWATNITILTIIRSAIWLEWWFVIISVVPIGFRIGTENCKQSNNLALWHWLHFGWHVTGSLQCTLAVYLLHNCPLEDNVSFCRKMHQRNLSENILTTLLHEKNFLQF